METQLQKIYKRFKKGWPALLQVPEAWHDVIFMLDGDIAREVPDYELISVKIKKDSDPRELIFYVDGIPDELEGVVDDLIENATNECRMIDRRARISKDLKEALESIAEKHNVNTKIIIIDAIVQDVTDEFVLWEK